MRSPPPRSHPSSKEVQLARHGIRTRFWIELGLACLSGLLAGATIAWREWIELVFRIDPDQGSGALEVAVTIVFVVATFAFALASRLEWQRSAPHTAD
jgi:hypothetical protein